MSEEKTRDEDEKGVPLRDRQLLRVRSVPRMRRSWQWRG